MREWLDEVNAAHDDQQGQKETSTVDAALLDRILEMNLSKEIDTLEGET